MSFGVLVPLNSIWLNPSALNFKGLRCNSRYLEIKGVCSRTKPTSSKRMQYSTPLGNKIIFFKIIVEALVIYVFLDQVSHHSYSYLLFPNQEFFVEHLALLVLV